MQSFYLQQSLIASTYGEFQIVLTYMMLFLIFYSKISKFFGEQGFKLPEDYPNKQFIQRFIRIYEDITSQIVLDKDEKLLVQKTFNNTLFNANELKGETDKKIKARKNKTVAFGAVDIVLYAKE